jgi:hypothetical protein
MSYKSIIDYSEIITREGMMLQKGMNFRIKHGYSIILMSVRKGAPYQDKWHEDTGLLEYEGHDEQGRAGIEPKKINQPLRNSSGTLTENGKFFEAALAYKEKKQKAEIVQVYEKIAQGIWCDRGRYELIDANIESDGIRNVCKFFLRTSKTPRANKPILTQTRLIPTSIKVEVWKRDQGHCVICGSEDNLHFDHDVPYSKGGSSITAKNVRLLCARHNLSKSDKIMTFAPWLTTLASAFISRAS